MRVAPPARALADLAMTHTPGELAAALAAGVQSGRVCIDDVREHAVRLRGRPGGADLNGVLAEFDPAFESVLGRELCEVLRDGGFSNFVAGDRIDFPGGGYRIGDAVVRELRLDFEADGFAYHGTKEQQQADTGRDRDLGLALYRTVRFTSDDLRRNRAATVASIPRIIEARAREIGMYAPRRVITVR